LSTGRHLLRPVFKNTAFQSGHLANVTVNAVGLKDSPDAIKVIYLDSSELGWRESKEIRVEFLVEINPAVIGPQPSGKTFRVQFFGPKGNELYSEEIEIKLCSPFA